MNRRKPITRRLKPSYRDAVLLLKLVEIYNRENEAFRWVLFEFNTADYAEFKTKFPARSRKRGLFNSVCIFFELCGVLMKHRLINAELFYDVFSVEPFWKKAEKIAVGMRKDLDDERIYENFERLAVLALEFK